MVYPYINRIMWDYITTHRIHVWHADNWGILMVNVAMIMAYIRILWAIVSIIYIYIYIYVVTMENIWHYDMVLLYTDIWRFPHFRGGVPLTKKTNLSFWDPPHLCFGPRLGGNISWVEPSLTRRVPGRSTQTTPQKTHEKMLISPWINGDFSMKH